jgi:LuxR family transcriptional regulator, maltose regulon positive regulatory protein
VLASQVTGRMLATKAAPGCPARPAPSSRRSLMSGSARAKSAMPARRSVSRKATRLVWDVLDGTAPVIGYVTLVEAQLLAGLAQREPVTCVRGTRRLNGRWPWRSLTGWSCRSR